MILLYHIEVKVRLLGENLVFFDRSYPHQPGTFRLLFCLYSHFSVIYSKN